MHVRQLRFSHQRTFYKRMNDRSNGRFKSLLRGPSLSSLLSRKIRRARPLVAPKTRQSLLGRSCQLGVAGARTKLAQMRLLSRLSDSQPVVVSAFRYKSTSIPMKFRHNDPLTIGCQAKPAQANWTIQNGENGTD